MSVVTVESRNSWPLQNGSWPLNSICIDLWGCNLNSATDLVPVASLQISWYSENLVSRPFSLAHSTLSKIQRYIRSMLVPFALELHLRAQTIQDCRYRLIRVSQTLANFLIVSLSSQSTSRCMLGTGEEVINSVPLCSMAHAQPWQCYVCGTACRAIR